MVCESTVTPPKHIHTNTLIFPQNVAHDLTNIFLFPMSANDCETFWDTDPLTDSCYQFNFQSMLSWYEARVSCQQQGADLLSITKLHEQTYINGK